MRPPTSHFAVARLSLSIVLLGIATANAQTLPQKPALSGHPRLYFTPEELPKLRAFREHGLHQQIWKNLQASADWAMTRSPRRDWIAPVSPDPIYENLYDRFYAIMGDLAITEHLAFAYALSGERRYGDAARQWTLASCRAWKHEADGQPDGGKAYAVMRLLKGIAVGYDAAYDCFTDDERREIRDTLVSIGGKYYAGYFTTPTIAGEGFHTHHATVEWSSFGVAALALLGDSPQAQTWLDATIKKFETHLLPSGLAPDGAQVEGATFWASTMQYRLFFMDALRRVTGRDLFAKFAPQMNADYALATIAGEHHADSCESNQSIILSPSYGQLDYYAPVLLFLAREYRQSLCRQIALCDHTLGSIQRTRYITPHGEQLLFELGGYAYVWLEEGIPAKFPASAAAAPDATQPADTAIAKLSYHFPSVDEAYLRSSFRPGDIVLGVRKGELVVHCAGDAVLIEPTDAPNPPTTRPVRSLQDDGHVATLICEGDDHRPLNIELHRAAGRVLIRRQCNGDWQWSCQGDPIRSENQLTWKNGATLRVLTGTISKWEPRGYAPALAVGFNKLVLADPAPQKFPRCTITPAADGQVAVEITRP